MCPSIRYWPTCTRTIFDRTSNSANIFLLSFADSTEHARSPKAVWDEIGEAFIRELDYSQIILKLNTAEKDTREDIIASHSMDMNAFLEACLVRFHLYYTDALHI